MLITLKALESVAIANPDEVVTMSPGELVTFAPRAHENSIVTTLTKPDGTYAMVRPQYLIHALREKWFEFHSVEPEGPVLKGTLASDFELGDQEFLAGDAATVDFCMFEDGVLNLRVSFPRAVLIMDPALVNQTCAEIGIKFLFEEELSPTP